jgi:hypothetical protein
VYARIARFEGANPSRMDERIETNRRYIEQSLESPPEGFEAAKGVWMLIDRKAGRGLGITLFETEDDLRKGDDALNKMSPPDVEGGRRTSVEVYEVVFKRELA